MNFTGRPEDAVALSVTGDWDSFTFGKDPKVIVWLTWSAMVLFVTSGAAS
jgi:hypothetical protein